MTFRVLLAATATMLAACSPAPEASDPEPTAADYAAVAAPLANARVTSPLTVSGTAPAGWYDEDQFDALLIGEDGTVYSQAPARVDPDWQGAGDRPFAAEFAFTVSGDTPANVVLQERVVEDQDEQLEVRVPVVLAPAG